MKAASAFLIGSTVLSLLAPLPAFTATPQAIDQGTNWNAAARKDFYSRDQGSRIMPLRWIAALKQPGGEPFMADSLSRYGYLPNEESRPAGLPIGFTVASGSNDQEIGMNCSACHTREIEVEGVPYRIDGGPGIVDFQSFLADLDKAVNTVLTDQQAFADFARAVLGPTARRGGKGEIAQSGAGLAPALSYPDERRPAGSALGAGAAGRCIHDFQPPHRPRYRAAAHLHDPGEYQTRHRSGPLPLPLERSDPGQDPMARLCR